jgi:hypothetical protein
MDASAPSQPPLNTAYENPSNPTSQDPVEKSSSQSTSASQSRSDAATEHRAPNDVPQEEATPSALGAGGRGEKDTPDVCHFLIPLLQLRPQIFPFDSKR